MSGHGSYPPPGSPPPPAPGWQAAPPAGPAYPPGPGYPAYPAMLPAAHKPGAIPLRPLSLGDIYDGAFKIIRFNPKSTVGAAVLVASVAMVIPILVSSVLAIVLNLSLLSFDEQGMPTDSGAGFLVTYGSIIAGSVLQTFGLVFVTGMVAHVTAAAAIGHRLSLGAAWAATLGKRWRLVALWLLMMAITVVYMLIVVAVIVVLALVVATWITVLVSIGLVAASVCALVYFWVRVYYLAVPPLMLEPIGLFEALGRSFTLTSRQFWRTFGIALLTIVITQIAGGMIGTPFTIAGAVGMVAAGDSPAGLIIMVVSNALSGIITAAFVTPFSGAVASLQYIDQRIRKEGYDVELMTRAGLVRP
jgi:hypothetical protein